MKTDLKYFDGMKSLRLFAAILPFLLIAASCKDVNPVDPDEGDVEAPQIQLGKSVVNLASDGAAVDVAYLIENEIEGEKISFDYDADWLVVSADKARIITVSAQTNETGKSREAEIVLSYKNAEDVVLEVTQDFFVSPLTISVTDVTATGVEFSITTSDPELTWIPMVTYKEGFEYYETPDELFASDLEYFRYLADINDQTLQEFLASMVATGSLDDVYLDGLQPSTEYVLYAYGVTTDGRRTTDIVSEPFVTEVPYEGDITFSFEVTENDYILEYSIIPSHTGVPYYYGIVTESQLNQWKEQYGDDIRTAIQEGEINPSIEELMNYDMISGPEGYFEVFGESDVVDWGYFEAAADTKYVLFAAKWNEQCELIGPVSTYEHTTAPIEPSDNQITLEVTNITQSSADISTTVTTDDPYVVIPVRSSEVVGMADDEVFAYLVSKYDYIMSEYTFVGNKTRTYSRMRPDNDYVFFAFGYKAGTMTTAEMDRFEFRTLEAGDPADCTFEFSCEPDVDCAWVEVVPSDKGQFYHWLVYPSYYTANDAKNYIKAVIRDGYEGDVASFSSWELSLGTDSATAWDLFPETEYKVGAIVMDYDTGEFLSEMFFSEPFKTLAKTYADITINMEYGPYYDLGELIKAGQTQFEPLLEDGNALLPIKVTTEGECSAFYYDIYANDLSDTEKYPDEIFYAGLIGGGCPNASSIFVVKYDTPMTLTAVAYDNEDNPTQIYRDVMRFTQDGASPARDFIAQQGSKSTKSVSQFELDMEFPTAVKNRDSVRISKDELQRKHDDAMKKVKELRIEKMQKKVSEARLRKTKRIARR